MPAKLFPDKGKENASMHCKGLIFLDITKMTGKMIEKIRHQVNK